MTLTSYRDLERELVRATSVVGIAPPVPGQDAADFLGGVARDARGGLVLILDNLEEVFAPRRRTARGRRRRRGRRDGAAGRPGGAAHAPGPGGRRRRLRAPRNDHDRARRTVGQAGRAGDDDAAAPDGGRDRRHHRAQRRAVGDAVRGRPGRRRRRRSGAQRALPSVRSPARRARHRRSAGWRRCAATAAAAARRFSRRCGWRTCAGRPAGGASRAARCSPPARRTASAKPIWACRPGADGTAAPRRSPRCSRAGCWSRTLRGRKEVFELAHPRCARSSRTSRSPIGRAPPTPAGRSPAGSRPASACACRSWSRFTCTCAGR